MSSPEPQLPQAQLTEGQTRRRTIKSLAVLAASLFGGWEVFNWVKHRPPESGAPKPLRKVLSANEEIFKSTFDKDRLIKEYPVSAAAKNVRVNGKVGLRDGVDMANWRFQVARTNGEMLNLTLDDIKSLPKKEVVFDFKCIEGWSQVSRWAGVPVKTFMDHYGLKVEAGLKYMGLQTPDKKYYVGIDMQSALHPQTLLCYEMNGQPLPPEQGYPMRLIIPVKYGIKHLKRLSTMVFSNQKPADYWAERGYDYYAGH